MLRPTSRKLSTPSRSSPEKWGTICASTGSFVSMPKLSVKMMTICTHVLEQTGVPGIYACWGFGMKTDSNVLQELVARPYLLCTVYLV
jgi:hypothetical protein